MRKYIFAAICLFFGAAAGAQELKEYMTDPLGVSLSLEGSNLDVSVDLNIEELLVKNNTLVTLTPVLINGEDSTSLSTGSGTSVTRTVSRMHSRSSVSGKKIFHRPGAGRSLCLSRSG